MRRWFTFFSEIIISHGGTIDKYIGDCVMAIWGAPEPVTNSQFHACQAAMEFNQALEILNMGLPKSMPKVNCRVGIHYGSVLVGNIGYEQRMNYTVCGNAANIAARLEQAGKLYGLSPLISGDIYNEVKHDYLCIWLDAAVLRGYNKRITEVFHLVGRYEDTTEEQRQVAKTMKSLRCKLKLKQFVAASEVLAECQNDSIYAPYKQAMALLEEHCIQESFHVRKVKRGASANSAGSSLSTGSGFNSSVSGNASGSASEGVEAIDSDCGGNLSY